MMISGPDVELYIPAVHLWQVQRQHPTSTSSTLRVGWDMVSFMYIFLLYPISCSILHAVSRLTPHHKGLGLDREKPIGVVSEQGRWYQPSDHPVHVLFKRNGQDPTDIVYPEVGSPEWTAAYPSRELDIASLPSAWIDALDHAVAQGRIPDIPPSVMIDDTPTYPGGLDPMSDFVCSTTPKCNSNPDVWWDAPAGIWATSFDDGPLPASDRLFEFLDENEEHATHFFIGVHIREYPERFLTAFETLGGMHIVYPKGLSIIYTHEILVDDIAVHTWTHPHMTTLSNLEILGELGWTMEIIHNSTGGLVPAYWRPPFGDSDNRVNAIAKEVFGLTTVIWNRDTQDWGIESNFTNVPQIEVQVDDWVRGPRSPGLMVLEHELSHETVQAFINIYPVVKDHGWKMMSLAQINGTWANRNPQGSLLRPIGNDDSSPQPMSKEESIMALIRSFRPERYWRTGDQEAYRHFGADSS
ncbi:hypothetical protein NLI96_g5475 [Meripilus lineatus]|uniref:chitin deacetylase n=1 Tax=Meripilus lineatus TaxID=2056292 RepID=A0AAD5YER9_9APHY|nr:hypothetical protein NLI96_g5475 [Physisporinus lineatus]